MAYQTKEVLIELQSILKANKLQPRVTVNELIPLAELTTDISVDIALESVIYDQDANSSGKSGYLRSFLINIHIGVYCKDELLRLMDVVDSLEGSILRDNALWEVIIDRDISTVTYDHAKSLPYRGATILMEARIRMDDCT